MSDAPDMDWPQASAEAAAAQTRQLALLVRQLDGLEQLDQGLLKLLGRLPSRPADIWSVLADSPFRAALHAAFGPSGDAASAGPPDVPAQVLYAAALRQSVRNVMGPPEAMEESIWQHSLLVAGLAQLAAEQLSQAKPVAAPLAAFSAGLLHDIGKLALAHCLPKSFARLGRPPWAQMDAMQAERKVLEADHVTVGRRLGRHWRLPAHIRDVIWLHHQLPDAIPDQLESARLVRLVRWADRAAFEGPALKPFTATQAAAAAEQLGLSESELDRIVRLFPERMRQFNGLSLVAASWDDAAGQAALVCPQTQTKPSPDVLAQVVRLAERLRPESSLAQVCQAVAEAFLVATNNGTAAIGGFAVAGTNLTLAMSDLSGSDVRSFTCQSAPAGPAEPLCAQRLLRRLLGEPAGHAIQCLNGLMCVGLEVDQRLVGGILLPAEQAGPAGLEELGPLMRLARFAIAAVVERAEADELVERLARANQHLAATRKALVEAKALAAVGEMAAGAAHEMNNPLAVISGRAQLLAGSAVDPADRKTGELIARKAQDLSDLITELMAFAHPATPQPQAIDPLEMFQAVRVRLADTAQADAGDGRTQDPPAQSKLPCLPADIRIQLGSPRADQPGDETQRCPRLYADRGQLEEILMELVRNAVTASQGRASVCFEAWADPAGAAVLLTVRDDGPGMDEATLARAFTPFFSSRPAGRGRGMGLARARRAVEANGGSMWIDSRPGQGATFFLRLPQADRERA